MFNNERRGDQPEEFPLRFWPFMQREKIFDYADAEHGVDVAAAISLEQVNALLDVFGEFPRERVVLSPNGYNQDVFGPLPDGTDRAAILARFFTQPLDGSDQAPEPVAPPEGFDAVVAFCGKFADWKRLDALLRAAAIYEQYEYRILTLVIGSGPPQAQRAMHELSTELGLRRTYFLGPRPQDELALLFGCADVGCFPSYREPFGLVFVECMACGTPVIGADSGGPRDFVTSEVGTLVPETDDRMRSQLRWPTRSIKPYRGLEAHARARRRAIRTEPIQRDRSGLASARRGRPTDQLTAPTSGFDRRILFAA